MILADLVEGKMGVKSDCESERVNNTKCAREEMEKLTTSSASPTSRPKSPTNTLYSPSHRGCTPGKPVPQLSLNTRAERGIKTGGAAAKRERTEAACAAVGKVRKQYPDEGLSAKKRSASNSSSRHVELEMCRGRNDLYLAPRIILMLVTPSQPMRAQHSRTYASSIQTSKSPK